MHSWAEVHRLHEREKLNKTAIARRLGMSRNTVDRLLRLEEPPSYERRSKGSLLDAFKPDIGELLETSFLPAREFLSLDDLQEQHDGWAVDVAHRRHHRRVGSKVVDAYNVERGFLSPLPHPLPDTSAHLETKAGKDIFIRVLGADYSIPPGLSGRRLSVTTSLREVRFFLEGREIASHPRSYVPADVVLDPSHARALRLSREATAHLIRGDVDVEAVDLTRYDRLAEVPS